MQNVHNFITDRIHKVHKTTLTKQKMHFV